jgi:hypothetical protein
VWVGAYKKKNKAPPLGITKQPFFFFPIIKLNEVALYTHPPPLTHSHHPLFSLWWCSGVRVFLVPGEEGLWMGSDLSIGGSFFFWEGRGEWELPLGVGGQGFFYVLRLNKKNK